MKLLLLFQHTAVFLLNYNLMVFLFGWIQVVQSYDDEKRARVLQFVTGSSRVPLEGFKALQGKPVFSIASVYTVLCVHRIHDDCCSSHRVNRSNWSQTFHYTSS